jgi:hypothetical protein
MAEPDPIGVTLSIGGGRISSLSSSSGSTRGSANPCTVLKLSYLAPREMPGSRPGMTNLVIATAPQTLT